jgi:DNA-binding GntR family transcriptional regulator
VGEHVSFQPKIRQSLREEIATDIKLAILSGRFSAGDRIYEGRIADEMGVSRVPVREALSSLEHEGLVERVPNRGVFVARLSAYEVEEFSSLRSVFEEFAMERAMTRATPADVVRLEEQLEVMGNAVNGRDKAAIFEADLAFHQLLVQAAHHGVLLKFWEQIATMLRAQFITLLPVIYPVSEDLVGRHKMLLCAMLGSDVDSSRALIRDHVQIYGEILTSEARRQGLMGDDDEVMT